MNFDIISFLLVSLLFVPNSKEFCGAIQLPKLKEMYYARNVHHLEALEDVEDLIYNLVKEKRGEFVHSALESNPKISHLIDLIDNYKKDFEETSLKLRQEYVPDERFRGRYRVAWNPLATMQMIQRMRIKVSKLIKAFDAYVLTQDTATEIKNLMVHRGLKWPTFEDSKNITLSVLKIQHMYHLAASDVAQGKLLGADTGIKLNGADCLCIGNIAARKEFYFLAIYWIEEALEKFKKDGTPGKRVKFAKELLRNVSIRHDSKWDAENEHVFMTKIEGQNSRDLLTLQQLMFYDRGKVRSQQWNRYIQYRFQRLCMGKSLQTPAEQANLFCWFETKTSPYLRIRPAKVELLSKDLLILRYHDLLTEKLRLDLLDAAQNDLQPSLVFPINIQRMDKMHSDVRTSFGTAIPESYPGVWKLLRKHLESITRFSMDKETGAEPLGISSYTSGSYYDLHMDTLDVPPTHPEGGDRIATFVIYLNNVEKGGGTAFPCAEILAEPIPGSGIFWYNMKANGLADERSLHGACPVILGEKWIGNKWIRAADQFQSHKCLKGKTSFNFRVNGKVFNMGDSNFERKL